MSAVVTHPIPAPSSASSAERWQRANERAVAAQVIVTPVGDLGTYRVTSASHPGVVYESDGVHCTCQAAVFGDAICLHRAAVHAYVDAQTTRCAVCSGTGVEYISIWNWRTGEANTISEMPCRCQQAIEPEPLPPTTPSASLRLEQELAEAEADLARNHEALDRLNTKMDRQGWLNDRDFAALSREGDCNRDIHDRIRELRAQIAEIAPVAA